jgi:hypothetical protein
MFEIIDDFYNYDREERILDYNYNILTIHSEYNSNLIDYEIILNFSEDLNSDITLSNINTQILSFIQSKQYIKNILDSYVSNIELEEQFIRDINRCKLYINGHIVKNSFNALNYIQYTYGKKSKNILGLCTQATLASIFEWLLFSLKEDYHLAECCNKKDKTAFIFIDNNQFIYKKQLRIFKLINGDDITIKNVKINITIDNLLDDNENIMLEITILNIKKTKKIIKLSVKNK